MRSKNAITATMASARWPQNASRPPINPAPDPDEFLSFIYVGRRGCHQRCWRCQPTVLRFGECFRCTLSSPNRCVAGVAGCRRRPIQVSVSGEPG